MSIRPIHSPDDVRAIEAHPFEAYLRYTSVMHALETQQAKHPDGIALKYIQSADLDEPAQQWTYPSSWPRSGAPRACFNRSAAIRRRAWPFCCRRFRRRTSRCGGLKPWASPAPSTTC